MHFIKMLKLNKNIGTKGLKNFGILYWGKNNTTKVKAVICTNECLLFIHKCRFTKFEYYKIKHN